jgi:polar amino acid transport system substrate-binding protein
MKLPFNGLRLKQKNTVHKTVYTNSSTFQAANLILLSIIFLLYSINSLAVQSDQVLNKVKHFNLVTAVYPPYNYQSEGIKGLNIDIIKAAFSAVGYQLNVKILPFSRAFQYAKQGAVDGITLWYSKDRAQWFEFSTSLTRSQLILLKPNALQVNYQSLNDLIPFTIGTVRNYAYPESFSDHLGIKKDQVLTDEQNINKLILGRIDIALIDKRMAKFILRKNHPEQQYSFNSAGILKNEKYYLAVSKNSNNYKQKLADFNLGLAKIKANGVLEKITSEYDE